MKMIYKTIIFGFILIGYMQFAQAGEGGGKITKIIVHHTSDGGGVVMFKSQQHNNTPSCNSQLEWAFDLNSSEGKGMYSLILSAGAQKLPVLIHGHNDCASWADRERPRFISVQY